MVVGTSTGGALLVVCYYILQLVDAGQGCMVDCSNDEILSLSPPSITEEKLAVLHGKCHSICMNQIIGGHRMEKLDCDAIQSIESCQEGCLLHNLHPKKMIKQSCNNRCVEKCGELDGVKWKRVYLAEGCPKLCKKEYCEKGCSLKRIPKKKDLHLSIPTPEVEPVLGQPAGHFHLSLTQLYDHNVKDLRVSSVIKITDMTTGNIYYAWQPGLNFTIDLEYFTCKQVSLSLRVVFGHQMTPFSSPVVKCVGKNIPTHEKHFVDFFTTQTLSKLEAIDKMTNELLEFVHSKLGTSSTANELTEKLKKLKHKIDS